MQTQSMPTCPTWPWSWEQDRIEHTEVRDRLLSDAWEKDLCDFLSLVWGPVKQAAVGIPDFSWNALSTLARQLSTPGLYSRRPTVYGPPEGEGLVGEGGLLDGAMWAPLQQQTEYLARGMGDVFVRPSVLDGRLVLRVVKPWAVHVEPDHRDPLRAAELWERVLYRDADGRWSWCWEVFDVRGPTPSWKVVSATERGKDGLPMPVTNLYYPEYQAEGLAGSDYTWTYEDGTAYVPYVHYRSRLMGTYWSWEHLRGLHRGTFHCARIANTTLYAADMTAQRVVLLQNCAPVGVEVVNIGTKGALRTQELLPGTMVPLVALDPSNATMNVTEVGPGSDPLNLWSVVRSYTLSMLASHGLREADVTRAEANPTSAAALIVSDASRREAQRQLAPLAAEADQELIRMCAALARVHGLGVYPETGYRVTYSLISKTSDELAAERDEEDFELQHGLTSTVALYMKRKGVDRPTAIRELKRVQADEAELAATEARPVPVPPKADMATTDPTPYEE